MRNRGSVVIIDDNEVALIKRIKEDEIYYVFPGGGIEEGEKPKDAAVREAYEELGVHVNVKQLLKTVEYNGIQYFYLAEVVSGTFGSGSATEFNCSSNGSYEPMWVPLAMLGELDIRPMEMVSAIRLHHK